MMAIELKAFGQVQAMSGMPMVSGIKLKLCTLSVEIYLGGNPSSFDHV